MATLNLEVLDALRSRTFTANELASQFGYSINTIREFMDRMERTEVVSKVATKSPNRSGRPSINYSLRSNFLRRMPYLKSFYKDEWTIINPSVVLNFYNKNTKAHQAISNLPIIMANLMSIGHEYNEAFLNDTLDDNLARRLNRQLSLIKKELEENVEMVRKTFNLQKQIVSNEDFWNPGTLAQFFNTQLAHPSGKPIPPLDITDALTIIEKEREKNAG